MVTMKIADCFDKKRTLKSLGVIQAIINNDPSKSIRSIAKDVGVSDFLIHQEVHEYIHYFSYKIRKILFLSQIMKNKRKDHIVKLINKFKHPHYMNMLCLFSDETNFSHNHMVNSQNNVGLLYSHKMILTKKQTLSPYHGVWSGQ